MTYNCNTLQYIRKLETTPNSRPLTYKPMHYYTNYIHRVHARQYSPSSVDDMHATQCKAFRVIKQRAERRSQALLKQVDSMLATSGSADTHSTLSEYSNDTSSLLKLLYGYVPMKIFQE